MNSSQAEATKGDILVVDDQPNNLRLLSNLLTEHGYQVRKVLSGHLALKAIQVNPPDLILLDILMPEIDGYEVCSLLKASEQTRDIPVIFLSALNETIDKVKAFQLGGVDYISKPFQLEEVVARVENQLTIRQLSLQLKDQNAQLQQEIRNRITTELALLDLNQELENRVATRTEELRLANEKLQQLEVQLRQALTQEKELNQFYNRILATIAHEYRTPLTALSSSAQILDLYRDKLTPEKQHKHLQRMQSAVKHLTRLVNDVLFLSKTELDKVDLTPVPLKLAEFCREIVEELQLTATNRHTLQFNYQENCPEREWDERVLRQILTNLLSNAIKYSPNGGVIDFQLYYEQDEIILQIKDQGIGIPPENQARLFESFHRASNVGMIQGTGLGLSIVKKCVDLYKGKIYCQSEVGAGTTFTVKLPL
ncbi:MAG TPA: hybrid sensor histidine kinase/response regulator [Cyanobacteria bacterium UBA8803]|nr:hybrid sensor histidine kinase/response regulator [Cyanobacteria bacterium UBA8803]